MRDIKVWANGDGSDESINIQAAVNDASSGDILYFSAPGRYCFSNIILPPHFRVIIAPGATFAPPPGASAGSFFFTISGGGDIVIDGARADDTYLMSGLLKATTTNDITLTNCWHTNPSNGFELDTFKIQGGLAYFDRCSNVRVSDCKSSGGTMGVSFVSCSNPSVYGGEYKNLKRDGVLFYSGSNSAKAINVRVEGYGIGNEPGRAGIHFYGSEYGISYGCDVTNGYGAASALRARDANKITFSNNILNYCENGQGIEVTYIGDFQPLTGGECIITGNQVYDFSQRGIGLNFEPCQEAIIDANYIDGIRNRDDGGDYGYGILSQSSASISRNRVKNTGGVGIVVNSDSIVTHNRILNVASGPIGTKTALYVLGTNSEVDHNRVDATGLDYGIRVGPSCSAKIGTDNVITGASLDIFNEGTLL